MSSTIPDNPEDTLVNRETTLEKKEAPPFKPKPVNIQGTNFLPKYRNSLNIGKVPPTPPRSPSPQVKRPNLDEHELRPLPIDPVYKKGPGVPDVKPLPVAKLPLKKMSLPKKNILPKIPPKELTDVTQVVMENGAKEPQSVKTSHDEPQDIKIEEEDIADVDEIDINDPSFNLEEQLTSLNYIEDTMDISETDDPPPPPPVSGDSDFAFDTYVSPREMPEETEHQDPKEEQLPTFKNIFSGDQSDQMNTPDIIQFEQAENVVVEEQKEEDGNPPPNLDPLPSNLHPKGPPPALPQGVVHPDSLITPSDLENNEEIKKKKGKFTQLKGFFKKKKKEEDTDFKSKNTKQKEEETPISALQDRLEKYWKLVDLLSKEDNNLLYLISTLVNRADVDKQSRAWVKIFGTRGCLLSLLLKIIANEVTKTEHEGTLFRNNTFSVGLLSQYAHFIGKDYLRNVLASDLLQIIESDLNYEINPDGGLSEQEIDQNTMNLLSTCERLYNKIIGSKDTIPLEIRRICKELRDRVKAKFPSAVHTCVGGFLFLRFITPAVVTPEGYNLLDVTISIEKRRPLILISKTLQQISNEMYFSEDYLMSINSFITENVPGLQTFFDEVCDVDDNVTPSPMPEIQLTAETLKARDDAFIRIHQFIYKYMPEIKQQYQTFAGSCVADSLAELEKIMEGLEEPPDPKILKQPIPVNNKQKKDKKK